MLLRTSNRCQELSNGGIVAECLADVNEAVNIAWTKDETCAELEGILAEFVLVVACGVGAFARDRIVAAQKVE